MGIRLRIENMPRLLLILFTLLYGTCALANEEDRAERRELRERREKVRTAIRRMQKCIDDRDLTPCLESEEDLETRTAVMRYLTKKALKEGQAN